MEANKLAKRIVLLAALTGLPTWFLPYNQLTWWDWFVSDIAEYSLRPVVVFTCFFVISWDSYIEKFASFLYGWLTVFNLCNYIVQNNFDVQPIQTNLIFYAYMIVGFLLILRNWTRHNLINNQNTPYDPTKTYIARKRPASMRSLLVSIVYQWPVNTVSIIHEGRWYKMNTTFRPLAVNKRKLENYYLQEIQADERFIARLKNAIGTPFNLISKNCFSLVNQIT